MRDDELQVLGSTQQTGKRKIWVVAIVSMALLALLVAVGVIIYQRYAKHNVDSIQGESTILPELQQAVDSLLNNELEQICGQQGQVIVMEVQTGRILAMAGRERRFDGKFQPCKNFGYQQEPGSTMLTAALLALLETGEVKLDDKVDASSGVWAVDDDEIIDHNWRNGGYGEITLGRALEVSSYVAITKKVREMFHSKEQWYFDLLDRMSFGQPDSILGIVGLKPIHYSSPKDSLWASRKLLWNAIGYERQMAPIQILAFYNAIANNGKMVKPMLRQGRTEIINEQIASKENIAIMQQTLYNVVHQGLGRKASLNVTPIAGKTGTAIITPDNETGNEGFKEYHLSFCGYFPADAPKYSIIVSLNKLGLPASGGGMAGALFRDIADWMIKDTITVTQEMIK